MLRFIRLALFPVGLIAALPASAQDEGETPADDIVVTGVPLREGEETPVTLQDDGLSAVVSRQIASEVDRFARCADLPRPDLLRRIVDGKPESGEAQRALHEHILRNSGCYGTIFPPIPDTPYYGKCNPVMVNDIRGNNICRADYDRGEIYEQVLRKYAPDLVINRSITFNPEIRADFMAREERRNQDRVLSNDLFWFASCAVQIRPEYALAMMKEEAGSGREARLQELMIKDGLPCFAGGKVEEVTVDSRQFRAFVAEALYSWAVAVKNVDSLIPQDLG